MCCALRILSLVAALTLGGASAHADVGQRLHVAVGQPGSDSFAFGTELWAMGQIALMPKHSIVLASKEVPVDGDRLSLLKQGDVEAALVYGRVPERYRDDVRSIIEKRTASIAPPSTQAARDKVIDTGMVTGWGRHLGRHTGGRGWKSQNRRCTAAVERSVPEVCS